MSSYSEYARWGWATFPVAGPVYASNKEDYKTWKIPLVNWAQFQTRLPTLDEVTFWEKKWPLAYVGVTTGPFSNLFVIDTDGEKGKESLASLKIPLPITKISQTQRGHHFFFKWSKRLEGYVTSRNGLFPGIDIKGEGGYVIIPSAGGNRKWVCEEFCAELPEAWYAHLTKSEALPKNWQSKAIAEITTGNRHDTFVRLISSCFNAGWPVESVMAVLRPFAVEHNLDENLEELILDMQGRYYKETVVNSPDVSSARRKEMQEKTRGWISKLHPVDSFSSKLHAPILHKMMELQDQYDKEAVQWVEKESGPWNKSRPFTTSEKIMELSNEIRR